MAKRTSLSEFRTHIRNIGEWRTAYISDSELNTYINQGCYKFYSMMAEIDKLRYIKSTTIPTVSGTSDYALPDDFFKNVGVAIANDALDGYHLLDSFEWQERYTSSQTSTKNGTRFLIKGNSDTGAAQDGYHTVQLLPTPTFVANMLVDYLPVFSDLSSDGDSFDTINGMGFDWITFDVAIKCCAKEETDPAIYVSQKQEVGQILSMSGDQDSIQTQPTSTSTTLKGLQQAIRNRGGWKREDFTDTSLTEWVNSSIASLYDLMAMADRKHFLTKTDISVLSGTRDYTLPSDFYKLVGVSIVDGSKADGYTVLNSFNFNERYIADSNDAYGSRFDIQGDNISFQPTPTWTQTVRLEYIPTPTLLVQPTDTFDFKNSWQEHVILNSCVKAATLMQKPDSAMFVQQLSAVESRIVGSATRDLSDTQPVATSSTLGSIRQAIRNRGGWKREDLNDTSLTEWVNSSIGTLYDIMIAVDNKHFLTKSSISVLSGTRDYALPSDFYKVIGVSIVDGSKADGYTVLNSFNFEERYIVDNNDAYGSRFDIRGDNISFQPTPTWTQEVRLEYIPTPTLLTQSSNTFDFKNSWQEYVILGCCVKAATLKGSPDPQVYATQQSSVESRIVSSALRDVSEGQPVATSNTLLSLRQAIRNRGSWKREDLTDTSLTEWVNSSIGTLYDIMIAVDHRHFLTKSSISVSSGTRDYSLPSDFYKVVGVSIVDSSKADGYTVLNSFNFEERYVVDNNDAYNSRFDIRGDNISFQPTPTWTQEVRLEYISTPTLLTQPTDTFDFKNSWQEHVILGCCVKAATKVGAPDPQVFSQQQMSVENRIVASALRDISEGQPVSTSNTLGSLRQAIRNRAGWGREDLTDTSITEWVNSSIASLYDLMSNVDEKHFLEQEDISVLSGTRDYALPSDFYKLVGVAIVDGSKADGYTVLNSFNFNERYIADSNDAYNSRFDIRGESISFQPTPTWTQTVRLEYIPTPTLLTQPSDTFDFKNSWQEHVILNSCVKAATKTMSSENAAKPDPQIFMQQMIAVENRIVASAMRDISEGQPVSTSNTLGSIRQAIRNRGGWKREDLTDTSITEWVNSSIASLYDLMIVSDTTYFLTKTDISVVADTREYELPSDFYKSLGASVRDGSKPDGYSVLNKHEWDERYDYTYITYKYDARYEIRAGNISFQPTPNWTDVVRLEYVPTPTLLVQPSDTFDFKNSWQEMIILDCCLKASVFMASHSDEKSATGAQSAQLFGMQLQEIKSRISTSAEQDIGKPKTVVDQRRRGKYRFSGGRFR